MSLRATMHQTPARRGLLALLLLAACETSDADDRAGDDGAVVDYALDYNLVHATDGGSGGRGIRALSLLLDQGVLLADVSWAVDGGVAEPAQGDGPAPEPPGGPIVTTPTESEHNDVMLSETERATALELFSKPRWRQYVDERAMASDTDVLWTVFIRWKGGEIDAIKVPETTSHAANRQMMDYVLSLADAYVPSKPQ